jgi:ABC-type dipeptide/oligopeptide/nickel transport system permease subunit
MGFGMTSSHFIFIPGVLIVGVVIGWILGSRAAQDAMASEMRKREERAKKKADG